MGQIDRIIPLLDRVRQTAPGSWQACCPSHEDRRPSLSLRETDEGSVLLHCFGGCSVHDVVAAIGLEITDLFPPREHHGKPNRRPFPAMDALRAVAFECLVVATASAAMQTGRVLSPVDHDRLILAAERIQSALAAVAPNLRGVRQ